MAKAFKTNNLKDRRNQGFVHKANISETQGKLFYLIEKGAHGQVDSVVTSSPCPSGEQVWSEQEQCYVEKEVLGLLPDFSGTFNGAYPFTYEAALHQMNTCREKLIMVSIDEAMGLKNGKK